MDAADAAGPARIPARAAITEVAPAVVAAGLPRAGGSRVGRAGLANRAPSRASRSGWSPDGPT
jgi:hypothetical protein